MAETTKRGAEDALNEKHEPKVSQGEGGLQKENASPSCHQRDSVLSPGDTPKKTGRSSDRSVDHSPLHPHHQAKLGAKVSGVSSPAWERKGSSDSARGSAPLTPGRSRIKSTPRESETPEKGTSVPKFGEWDESDPSAADGYTQLFNIVREERQGGVGVTPSMAADSRFSNNRRQFRNRGSKGCCCFPWGGN